MVNSAKAIFLDRDGVIIEAPVINDTPKSSKTLNEIKLCKGIASFCKFYLKKNFYLIMITNQPDYSRKTNTKKNINNINNFLKKKLILHDVCVCFCDEKDNCINRKPNPGMILKSKKKYNLDLKKSFLIGDRWRDIGAGNNAKCKTIFINKNYKEKMKFKPTYEIKYLSEIYKIIK